MQRHTFTKFLIALSTVFVLAHSASADTINLMWDPNPEQSVVGYKVHVGTQSGSYTQHIDVGPTTTWSFTSATAGQQYCFAITAYASGPVEGPRSNEVCGYSNWPPALTNPGTQNSIIGQADSLQLAGSDPRGDVLTYSATGLPPGITVMASTGYIAGTPTTAGSYSVTARASDGVLTASQTFTWTVTAPDTTAPVVTITGPTSSSTYATTASTLSLGGTASDAVGVTQVSWVNNRGGSGTATGTTAWSAGIALQSGSNLLTVTARDAAGNIGSSGAISVQVNNATSAPGDIILHVGKTGVGHGTWRSEADSSAASGVRMRDPNAGAAKLKTALANPADYFEVTFDVQANVPYHFWFRGKADNNHWSNDSIFVQFSSGTPYTIGLVRSAMTPRYTDPGAMRPWP